MAGSMTICVVFDATGSMTQYAQAFADTIDRILGELALDTRLVAAGFVLFRDLGTAHRRFEIAHPMPLADAAGWLRRRTAEMAGGDDPAEPLLDAVFLAQHSFPWNGGTAVRGARRMAIVVANSDAKPQTVSLAEQVPAGLSAEDVARRLLRSGISVYALQAGQEDRGNLIRTLSTLAITTGGEFYPAALSRAEISRSFSSNLEALLSRPIQAGSATARRVEAVVRSRARGGTVIPLNILDDGMETRLRQAARTFRISSGGLLVNDAWVLEQPDLYRRMIEVDEDLLGWLLQFFSLLADSALDAVSLREALASRLEMLAGERVEPSVEVQALLERRLGIHFRGDLLKFRLGHLPDLSSRELISLQEQAASTAAALSSFRQKNLSRLARQSTVWMPAENLP